MAIEELTAIVPPPKNPVDAGPVEARDEIEKRIGTQLPQDIINFGITYGTGGFAEHEFGILNPFGRRYENSILGTCKIFLKLKNDEGDECIPYDTHPTKSGLFPCGATGNGDNLFWLTEGQPDNWPLVLHNRDTNEFQRWEMSVTSFVAGILQGTIHCILWGDESQSNLARVFEST